MDETLRKMQEDAKAVDNMLDEMLCNFVPADGMADYEPTTQELASKISETIEIKPKDLAVKLIKMGFHTRLVGTFFRWQIKII